MRTSPVALALRVAALIALPALAAAGDPPASPAVQRHPDTVDRLAKCSAAYATQYRILEATGNKVQRLAAASEKAYDAAIARSDEGQTKARFTEHYKAYLALNKAVAKATSDEERAAAARKLTSTLNADMDECERLEKKLEPATRAD